MNASKRAPEKDSGAFCIAFHRAAYPGPGILFNKKIDELGAEPEFGKLPVDMRHLLLNLNIADDYFKAVSRNEELQGIIDKKENDLYDIKHELVAAQMKLQSAGKKKKGSDA